MINTIVLRGRLAGDATLRETPTGTTVGSFRMAHNQYTTRNGERQETTLWVNVSLWGQLASKLVPHLVKGREVVVTGTLSQREWKDKDGNDRTSIEISAPDVDLITPREKADADSAPAQAEAKAAPRKGAPRKAWADSDDVDEDVMW